MNTYCNLIALLNAIKSNRVILRELYVIQGFFIGGHNLTNMRYADNAVLIVDTLRILQELLQKVVKNRGEMTKPQLQDRMHAC